MNLISRILQLKLIAGQFFRVVAKLSCDIQQPKPSRPNEGTLYINVELNPLAAEHFESGRQGELSTFINRQLDKCFQDSKCVDLESLCIVAEKKVFLFHCLIIFLLPN